MTQNALVKELKMEKYLLYPWYLWLVKQWLLTRCLCTALQSWGMLAERRSKSTERGNILGRF